MKRYALFAGRTYYPEGGWDDLVDTFDSADEAWERVRRDNRTAVARHALPPYQWHHVVDLTTGERV